MMTNREAFGVAFGAVVVATAYAVFFLHERTRLYDRVYRDIAAQCERPAVITTHGREYFCSEISKIDNPEDIPVVRAHLNRHEISL